MIDRRTLAIAALAGMASAASTRSVLAQAAVSRITAYAFSFPALAGGDIRLADYAGHPLLVVNTASLCGFTPQYGGLQALWTEFTIGDLVSSAFPPTISLRSPTDTRVKTAIARAFADT